MGIKPRTPELTQAEAIIACGLAADASVEEIAGVLGMSPRWTFELKARSANFINPLMLLMKPLVSISKKEIKQITAQQVAGELEKLLGHSLSALRKALESGDDATALNAAKEVLNRVSGKAAATLNVRGHVSHEHEHVVYVTNPEVLRSLDSNVLTDRELHDQARNLLTAKAPAQNVIDLEPAGTT